MLEKTEIINTSGQISERLDKTQVIMAMTPCCTEDKNGKKHFTCSICEWYFGCDKSICKPCNFGTGGILSHGVCVNPNPETNHYIQPCRSRGLFKESKLSEKRLGHFHSKWHEEAVEAACKHELVKQVLVDTHDLYGTKKTGRDLAKQQVEACQKLVEALKCFPRPSGGQVTEVSTEPQSKRKCNIILPITELNVLKDELEKHPEEQPLVLSFATVAVVKHVLDKEREELRACDERRAQLVTEMKEHIVGTPLHMESEVNYYWLKARMATLRTDIVLFQFQVNLKRAAYASVNLLQTTRLGPKPRELVIQPTDAHTPSDVDVGLSRQLSADEEEQVASKVFVDTFMDTQGGTFPKATCKFWHENLAHLSDVNTTGSGERFKVVFHIPGFLPSRTIKVTVVERMDNIIPHATDEGTFPGWKVHPAAGLALRALLKDRKGHEYLLGFDEKYGIYMDEVKKDGWPESVIKSIPDGHWFPLKEWAKTAYHQLKQPHQKEVREALKQMTDNGEEEALVAALLPKYWGSAESCKHELPNSMFKEG